MTRKQDAIGNAALQLAIRMYEAAAEKENTSDMGLAVAWAYQALSGQRLVAFHKAVGLDRAKIRKLKQLGEASNTFRKFKPRSQAPARQGRP